MAYTDDFSTIDICDATLGWEVGGQASTPDISTDIYKRGSGSIMAGKSGTLDVSFWYDKTLDDPIDVRLKIIVAWVYIEDEATLNLLDTSKSRIYLFDGSDNYAYWNLPKGFSLQMGWNSFRFLASRAATSLFTRDANGGTEPNYAAITAIRLYFETSSAETEITSGKILFDYWHYGIKINVDNISGTIPGLYAYDISKAIGCIFKGISYGAISTYYIGCQTHIGLLGTTTFTMSSMVLIVLPLTSVYATYGLFHILPSGTVTVGNTTDVTNKKGDNGIMFYSDAVEMSSINYPWFSYAGATATLYLYSSCFMGGAGGVKIFKGRVWGVDFRQDASLAVYSSNVDLYEITFYTDFSGYLFIGGAPTMDRILLQTRYAQYGCISVTGLTTNAYAYNATLFKTDVTRPHTYSYNFGVGTALYLIDLVVPEDELRCQWFRYGANYPRIYQQYRLPFKIVDKAGNGVEDVLIEIFDKDDNLVDSGSTDSDGEFTSDPLNYKQYDEEPGHTSVHMYTTVTNYGPHKIRISKAGWQTLEWATSIKKAFAAGSVNLALKAIDIILVNGQPVLNASAENPENEEYIPL